jgi:protein-S-isoprenylcysteine O-methyltransferase Ste14
MSVTAYFRASKTEFQIRYLLHVIVYLVGFTAPWNFFVHLDGAEPNAHAWGILAASLAKNGVGKIGSDFDGLLALGVLCAVAGAVLRTWGAAYLGSDVVKAGEMHTSGQAGGVIADGPFRHMRNPLYAGTFLHTFALALLMPVTGALFTILAIGLLQFRLIFGEEAFLQIKLGAPYTAYCRLVPRVWPVLRSKAAGSGMRAAWGQAIAGEFYMWGVALSFALLGPRYNATLLTQAVIVSVGLSIVVRALLQKPKPVTAPTL